MTVTYTGHETRRDKVVGKTFQFVHRPCVVLGTMYYLHVTYNLSQIIPLTQRRDFGTTTSHPVFVRVDLEKRRMVDGRRSCLYTK